MKTYTTLIVVPVMGHTRRGFPEAAALAACINRRISDSGEGSFQIGDKDGEILAFAEIEAELESSSIGHYLKIERLIMAAEYE